MQDRHPKVSEILTNKTGTITLRRRLVELFRHEPDATSLGLHLPNGRYEAAHNQHSDLVTGLLRISLRSVIPRKQRDGQFAISFLNSPS